MPSGCEATHSAATAEAKAAITAIRCALHLLESTAPSGRERRLLVAIHDELAQIHQALRLLSGR